MRKVFLEDLPKKEGIGALNGKNVIDWTGSIGYKVRFIYDDIEGEIEIRDYKPKAQQITALYNEKSFNISSSDFIRCKIGNIIGKRTKVFKVEIGRCFEDKNRNLTITDRKYEFDISNNQNRKWYSYRCNKCGFNGNIREDALLSLEQGCSCCSGATVVEGINDITTTAPWMINLGVDKEEAKKFTKSSSKKIKCTCPYCGEVTHKIISDLYNRKYIACKCGDGQSYISKYIYSLLKQLDLEFQTEMRYDWNKYINPKNNKLTQASIDFIIYHNDREIPLEADGGFHRIDNKMTGQTKEMSKLMDKQRDDNCLKYLGEETIRISDEGDIKKNILYSKLKELFDLTQIDWLKCEEYAIKSNIVKEVCEYWNNKKEWETTFDLVKQFNMSRYSVNLYLKNGSKLGWCDYNPKQEMKKSSCINGKNNSKAVEMFEDNVSLGVFDSCTELEQRSETMFGVKLLNSAIAMVCRGVRKHHKGYIFRYVEENNKEIT